MTDPVDHAETPQPYTRFGVVTYHGFVLRFSSVSQAWFVVVPHNRLEFIKGGIIGTAETVLEACDIVDRFAEKVAAFKRRKREQRESRDTLVGGA